MKLLSPAKASPKLAKYTGQDYEAAILYLAQANSSGYWLCPKSTSRTCAAGCLGTAGMAGVFKSIPEARIKKSRFFVEQREAFMLQLVKDLTALEKKAKKNGRIPAVRLNGTSDINWRMIKTDNGQDVFTRFPNIQFWDYTAVIGRIESLVRTPQKNYDVTFSRKADNDKDVMKALDLGFNVSIVLKLKKSQALPETLFGVTCQSGEDHDLRFLDKKMPNGSWIALRAKGKAKHDKGGFALESWTA